MASNSDPGNNKLSRHVIKLSKVSVFHMFKLPSSPKLPECNISQGRIGELALTCRDLREIVFYASERNFYY